MKYPIYFIAAMIATGLSCSNEPEMQNGYQFGDLTTIGLRDMAKIEKLREIYCADTSSPLNPGRMLAKRALIMAIQTKIPLYPEEGICLDLGKVFAPTGSEKNLLPEEQ